MGASEFKDCIFGVVILKRFLGIFDGAEEGPEKFRLYHRDIIET